MLARVNVAPLLYQEKKKKSKADHQLIHSFTVHWACPVHIFCSRHCSTFWRWDSERYRLCLHGYKEERKMGNIHKIQKEKEEWAIMQHDWGAAFVFWFLVFFAGSVQSSLKKWDEWGQETTRVNTELGEHSRWNQWLEELEPGDRKWLVC